MDLKGALDGLPAVSDETGLFLTFSLYFGSLALALLNPLRPEDDHGVADEFDDVSSELGDDLDEVLHVPVNDEG